MCLDKLARGEVFAALADTPAAFAHFSTGNYPGMVASPAVWPGDFAAAFPESGFEDLREVLTAGTLVYLEGAESTTPSFEQSLQ